jgi:hypothetical protein
MQEKDNVYSLIRLIDTISINATEDALPQASLNLTAFILLKSDAAIGTYSFQIIPRSPSGRVLTPAPILDIALAGEEGGIAIHAAVQVQPDIFGVYWFDVLVDGTRLTRIPLRLRTSLIGSETPSLPPDSVESGT